MIVVSGVVDVRPDKRDQVIELARMLMAETIKEDGCLSYRFYTDIDDDNRFHVFEQWQSEEALGAHFSTEHMAEFNRQMPDLVASAPELTRYDIASSEALPL